MKETTKELKNYTRKMCPYIKGGSNGGIEEQNRYNTLKTGSKIGVIGLYEHWP